MHDVRLGTGKEFGEDLIVMGLANAVGLDFKVRRGMSGRAERMKDGGLSLLFTPGT